MHKIRLRKCLVCGERIRIKVSRAGHYDNGHYFGELKLPVEGTGHWKKIGKTRIGRSSYDVVDWTGKEKKLEYWECSKCFDDAAHSCWLEETVEKLYGKRCKDFESGCPCCQAWGVYDVIREEISEKD